MGEHIRLSRVVRTPAVMAVGVGHSNCPEAPVTAGETAILRRANEVLGPEQAERWMRSRIASLDDQIPATLVKSEAGIRQVERVLLKIEHGVY